MQFSKEALAGLADKSQDAYAALFNDGSIDQPENQAAMDTLEPETLRLIAINVVRTCPKEQLNSLIPQTQHLLRTPASSFTQKLQDAYYVHNRINVITDKPQFAYKAWTQNFKPEAFHKNADFSHELLGNSASQQEKASYLAESTPRASLYSVMQNVRTAFPNTPAETEDSKSIKHSFTQHVKRALQAADHIDSLISCKEDSDLVEHLEKLTKHFATYPTVGTRPVITSAKEDLAKRIAGMNLANRAAACNHLTALCPKDGSNIFTEIADLVKNKVRAAHDHSADSDFEISRQGKDAASKSDAPDSPKLVNPGKLKCGIFGGCSTSKAEDNGDYYSDSDTEEEKKGSCWSWGQ
ncbi:hypothetical protein B1207_04490 [Legionella quinlivanii]|uniref:Uncharacterized protein n=1 Tax=Legionella quinlivanii TaxID=45073 RepID=A0A364LLM2_9GAMM|nr:hypothetical protein [Legionella quinlivanii]RAP37438.1 hypothetical protein B1207_04490 [Legionella quinlivanii]